MKKHNRKDLKHPLHNIGTQLHSRLYTKYSVSQNYYYTKDINSILENSSEEAALKYAQIEEQMEIQEHIKKPYTRYRSSKKLIKLSEYYKYHFEIPRIFMKDIFEIYFDYFDKKRKLNYVKVSNQIKIENGKDPYEEKRKSLEKKRLVKYKPLLPMGYSKPKSQKITEKSTRDQSKTLLDLV